MRWDNVWTIVRKEFSEYRVNRYILYTLVFMPILLAIVMPLIYVLPLSMSITPGTAQPIDLQIHPTQSFTGIDVPENRTYQGYQFTDCTIRNVIASDCIFDNCSLTYATVQSSNLTTCLVTDSTVVGSNLWNSTTVNSALPDSVFPGQESSDLTILKYLIDSLVIFFILIPAVIPTVISSYSIVGEKLNKSLEPLLATPASDSEILAGKAVAILLPAVLITWACVIPAILIVDLLTQSLFGGFVLPDLTMVLGVFLIAPLFCILSILVNIIVSSRVTDVRSSQQIGSLVVLPIVLFFIIALSGFLVPLFMLVVAAALLAANVAVFYVCLKVFRREEILVRWK